MIGRIIDQIVAPFAPRLAVQRMVARQAMASSKPPPRQVPSIAATMGRLNWAIRSQNACPVRDNCVASAASLQSASMLISAIGFERSVSEGCLSGEAEGRCDPLVGSLTHGLKLSHSCRPPFRRSRGIIESFAPGKFPTIRFPGPALRSPLNQ